MLLTTLVANNAILEPTEVTLPPTPADLTAETPTAVMVFSMLVRSAMTRTMSTMMVAHAAREIAVTESNKELKIAMMVLPTPTLSLTDADSTADATSAEMVLSTLTKNATLVLTDPLLAHPDVLVLSAVTVSDKLTKVRSATLVQTTPTLLFLDAHLFVPLTLAVKLCLDGTLT